jgi:hypothetical protein
MTDQPGPDGLDEAPADSTAEAPRADGASRRGDAKATPRGGRPAGYRGALPERVDRLARPWVIAVIATFALMLILAFAGIPSRLTPEPTPVPLPSVNAPSGSAAPSAS